MNYALLNENEKKILAILDENPFIQQQEIAKKIHLSRSATANLLSGLIEKGFLLGRAYVPNHAGRVLCIGGANQDMKMKAVKGIDLASSNSGILEMTFGGVMRNVCENLGRMGVLTSFITLVGDDPQGQRMLRELKPWVHVDYSEIVEDAVTGHYIAILDPEGELYTGFSDMRICERMDRKWIYTHKVHILQSEWIVVDCNVEKSAMEALIELSNEHDKKLVIIGVSDEKMSRVPQHLEGVHAVIVNHLEANTYFGHTESCGDHVQCFLDKGIEHVVITAGSEPVTYGDKNGIGMTDVPALKRPEIVDVTGAGDALSSGIVYGLTEGKSLKDSVQYGIINARYTIQSEHSVRKELVKQKLEEEVKEYEQSISRH